MIFAAAILLLSFTFVQAGKVIQLPTLKSQDFGLPGVPQIPWDYALSYPASACIGELWFTPEFTYYGPLSSYYYSDFNVFAFGDVRQATNGGAGVGGTRVDGRVAVLGTYDVRADSSVGHNTLTPGEQPFALVTGHNFAFWDGNVYPKEENIFVGGQVTTPCANGVEGKAGQCTPQYLVNRVRDGCHDLWTEFGVAETDQFNCLTPAFARAYGYYKTVQMIWAHHPDNCITELRTEWGGLTLIVTASVQNQRRYYVTIPEEVFGRLNNFQLLGFPDDAEFIVNLAFAGDFTIANKGKWPTLVGNFPGRVVYNVLSRGRLTIEDSRVPSLLAPDATIIQNSGRVEGFLIARNVEKLGTVFTVDCALNRVLSAKKTAKVADARANVEVQF